MPNAAPVAPAVLAPGDADAYLAGRGAEYTGGR
jgi:hypothetical protein